MPALVEFAVVRQKDLGHHAQHPAAMDRHGAIIELTLHPQRRADDEHRKPLPAGIDEPRELALDRVEHRVLEQEIIDRVGR